MSLGNDKVYNSDLIESMKMQIKCKSLKRASLISYHSGNYKQSKRSDTNLDELNECSWACGSGK